MILKTAALKSKQPTVNKQTATKKQKHYNLRYEMKTALQKNLRANCDRKG